MSRHVFRIAAVTTALFFLLIALNTLRTSGRQSTMPLTLDAKDPITYFIADGNGKTGYRSSDRELAQWALEAWRRAAARSFRLEPAPESRALVRLYWAEPGEGQYGEMRPLVVDGRPGAAVFIRPDVESLEHFHKSCSVFGVKKEAFAVGSGNGSEGSLGGEKQFAFRAGSLAAEDFFDLAPHIFDGIEVW
jgi:hypothetical protein